MARFLVVFGAALAAFLLACSGGSGGGGVGDGGAKRDAPVGTGDTPPPSPDGPPAARLMLSTTDLDLGTVNIGAMATNVVVVTNAGDQASAPLAVTFGPSADFKPTSNCTGRRLGIGETCAVTLQFAPTSVGMKAISGVVSQTEGPDMSRTFAAHGVGRLAPDAGMDAPREAGADGALDATATDTVRPEAAPDRPPPDAAGQ